MQLLSQSNNRGLFHAFFLLQAWSNAKSTSPFVLDPNRDTAGAVFHKELARELVEFILPIVEREGGTMSLMDVYCVFNRARGVGKEIAPLCFCSAA